MRNALPLIVLLFGCSAEKPAPVGPDYGEAGKTDSLHAPASTVSATPGTAQTASFTARSQYRAFTFDGQKGEKVSLYADGLKGLDTVAYLYKATSGAPTGRAIAQNDDTRDDSWTKNSLSSSIVNFVLPETRGYALVVTTYDGSTGKASVTVDAGGCTRNSDCAATDYCAAMTCGAAGQCQTRPQVCFEIYQPVCGCDGKQYSNSCVAAGAGDNVASAGPCTSTTN
jgi:Kazal-type serine protease inhibitor domain